MDRVVEFASQGFANGERFRLAAVSNRGLAEPVLSLTLAGAEVVVGVARRLDLATLDERPARPLERPPAPSLVMKEGAAEKHDDGTVTTRPERLLALDLERGVGITSIVSRGRSPGPPVRESSHHIQRIDLPKGYRSTLHFASGEPAAVVLSPDAQRAVCLDTLGRVAFFDLSSRKVLSGEVVRPPKDGRAAAAALAPDGRHWLMSTGGRIEVRVISKETPVAVIDLPGQSEEVTSALFLPDSSAFLVGTSHGLVLRFELLPERKRGSQTSPSPTSTSGKPDEERAAQIASIGAFCHAWQVRESTFSDDTPDVEIIAETRVEDRVTLSFVAHNYEYHFAQSGSDWADHFFFAGQATFEGKTLEDAQLTSYDKTGLTERATEDYHPGAMFAAWRAAKIKARAP